MIGLLVWLLAATPATAPLDCKKVNAGLGTQMDMTECAANAWHKADADLNRTYARLKLIMKKRDNDPFYKESGCYQNASNQRRVCITFENSLISSEKAWIYFRDADCVVSGYQERGGSLEPMLVFQCLEYLTRNRIKDLDNTITDFTNSNQ